VTCPQPHSRPTGGLDRWNQLHDVPPAFSKAARSGPSRGRRECFDDGVVTASLHEVRVSHRPFGAAAMWTSLTQPFTFTEGQGVATRAVAAVGGCDHARSSRTRGMTRVPYSSIAVISA
jgi:hypothetical protein